MKLAQSDKRAILEPSEIIMLKTLLKWPELVVEVSGSYQVNKLTNYATELATRFHEYYNKCRVINGQHVNERRLNEVKAVQIVLQNVLSSMGISAPQQM